MKIKLLAGVLIWVCIFGNKANAQWQTIFKDSINYSFACVYFMNNDTGFAGGFHYPFSSSFYGTIFRTFNGGQTWGSTLTTHYISAIQFVNDSIGYAGGQDGAVYNTVDLGAHWNYAGGAWADDLSGLFFLNKDTGYQSAAYIFNTTDMGVNWQPVFTSPAGAYTVSGKMLFTNSLTGYNAQGYYYNALANAASISKTTDGGNTWTDLTIFPDFYPHSCFFFNSDTGIAVGFNGKISKTNDGGSTWSIPDSIGQYPLMDIYFVTPSIGYITGGNNYYNNTNYFKGIIYKTSDGGNNWQVMDSSYYDGLVKMHFPSDSVGYAVGMNGIILKIINANSVSSSVQVITPNKNDIFISPNPATDKITISFLQQH